jgi:hypothetical protein
MGALKNHTCVRGETFSYQFEMQNGADGSAFNLTGYTGQSEVRDTTGRLVCTITVTFPSAGVVLLTIPAATTVSVREGVYEWDLFIRAASPETQLLHGEFEFTKPVSKRP